MPPTASWARRVLALVVDWFACTLVVLVVTGPAGWSDDRYSGFYTMGVFVVEATVLTALSGGSFGKLATRLRVIRVDGSNRPPNLLRSLLRAVMVCLVIPPLVFRPDGRGLHDMAAGTATTTLEDLSRLSGRG
ncbi:RDD family protein [Nocardioides guangzhouensis]|uniref:RDD family protein n=1 Tax=Nocardioides guangzhouensis TaxID=2497878 RepID=A0A4Q4ZAQ0_9ACTN|nr:RDD family protein [Nocardioides guangzhouensis]RYP84331.1 RDD family protein [Nocardioides guangzhouensis]